MIYLVYEKSTGYVVGSITATSKPDVLPQHDTITADSVPDFNLVKVVKGKLISFALEQRPGYVDPLGSEDLILAAVDTRRGELQMTHLTRGTGVAQEYVKIQAEYADYTKLVPATVAALSQLDLKKRFPTAMTEVTLGGQTLAQVMANYGVAITANDTNNRVIGRIAVISKARIRAAPTLAQKKGVYNGINWSWNPGF